MSVLSYLSEYGSNSEESDCEHENKACQRPRLPTPNLGGVPVVPSHEHKDDPLQHGGKTRSFPHVRGNWATFVFVEYADIEVLNELLDKLEERILSIFGECQRCDDFHVSLSKTIVLKYHLISAFSGSLQKALKTAESFELGFAGVKVYSNEEKTRTFVSLEVDSFAQKYLWDISKKVDQVLEDFQFPTFYEDPSFHMSILSINGNKESELNSVAESLNDILYEDTEKSFKTILIDTIKCKVGNKYFNYSLT